MLDLLKQVTEVYKRRALQITPSAMICEGNRVAVEAESYVELDNGKGYNNHYHCVFEIEDGTIKGIKEYMDTQPVQDRFVANCRGCRRGVLRRASRAGCGRARR